MRLYTHTGDEFILGVRCTPSTDGEDAPGGEDSNSLYWRYAFLQPTSSIAAPPNALRQHVNV
jgi:hypothetical protein